MLVWIFGQLPLKSKGIAKEQGLVVVSHKSHATLLYN